MATSFPVVITANLTATGAPTYLTERGWSQDLAQARLIHDPQQLEQLLAEAHTQQFTVCDPYSFPVREEAGRAVATTARERIRSSGPTVGVARAS